MSRAAGWALRRTCAAPGGLRTTTSPRARRAAAACAALLALAAAGCADLFVEPAPPGGVPIALSLVTPTTAAGGPAEAYAQADRVHVRITRGSEGVVVLDTTFAFVPTATETRIRVEVDPEADGVQHIVSVTVLRSTTALFRGGAVVALSPGGTNAVEITLDPVAVQLSLRREYPELTAYGETLQLEGVALFATGDELDDPLEWFSLDPEILEVTTSGRATARSDGVARVQAEFRGLVEQIQVSVRARIASIDVEPPSLELHPDETSRLTAVLRDANGNEISSPRQVTWRSSNADVAGVTADGLVVGRATGTAVITAASEGVEGAAEVRVLPPPVGAIDITPANAFIGVGMQTRFTARLFDVNGNLLPPRPVNWRSLNPGVASVDANGNAVALAEGRALIVAEVGGVADTATLDVGPAVEVVVIPSVATLGPEQDMLFQAQVIGTSNQGVRWTSSHPNTVTIFSSGLAVFGACGPPTVTITATSIPYPYASATAIITVVGCSSFQPPGW